MERDRYEYVEFVGMQSVPVLFNEKPSFSDLVARAREELHCHDDDGIVVEGVLCHGTDQFIRAQVQKQSLKRSNCRT